MARPPSRRDLRQLADREIVAPAAFDDPRPAAHAGVALRDLGQRAVEIEAGGVVAERARQRGDAAVGVHEARARLASHGPPLAVSAGFGERETGVAGYNHSLKHYLPVCCSCSKSAAKSPALVAVVRRPARDRRTGLVELSAPLIPPC